LKKTSLRPLGKGSGSTHLRQNYAQVKSTNHQSIQEPPAHMHTPPEQVPTLDKNGQAGSQNRSGRFHHNQLGRLPKSVRTIWYRRPHHQKPKMQKKCTSFPLGKGSRDVMQLFSTFLSPPWCQCMNQGSNWKTCNLELLKYTKCITRC
jgi:hypothetical protein